MTINPHEAWAIEVIVTGLVDPLRTGLVMFYVRREPLVVLRRILRRRWRVADPEPVLQEARRRVAVALVQGDQHVRRLEIA